MLCFIFTASLMVALALASEFKSCSHSELCIDIMDCPKYHKITRREKFDEKWKAAYQKDVKNFRKHFCNIDMSKPTPIFSVCCPTQLNSESCGLIDPQRVSYGKEAHDLELPWMGVLQTQQGNYVCGGTLISDRYVLTAAHCLAAVLDKVVAVRLGQAAITSTQNSASAVQIIPVEHIPHPWYSRRCMVNDIALLKLAKPAKFGDNVKPICLPNGTPEQAIPPDGLGQLIVSGWGLTEKGNAFDVLRYASLPHVPLEKCAQLGSNVKLDPRTQLCAGGVNLIDNCRGDSGGPLQTFSPGDKLRFIQYGVVAFGSETCGEQNVPGVYTNVEAYLSWIFKTVEGITVRREKVTFQLNCVHNRVTVTQQWK